MKILNYKNYLETIKASENSEMFRSLWVEENGEEKDILKNGELSCAYYVSSILKIFDLISNPHATAKSTIKDMIDSNWKETEELKPGNVLVWEEKQFKDSETHSHIGFYLGNNQAISNRFEWRLPTVHHYTYKNKRKIIQIFTHPLLLDKQLK